MAVTHLLDSEFPEFIAKNIAIIDFWAEWCAPCRAFAPVFEQVAEKYPNASFAKFEISDTNKATPVKYGVRSIPATIAFRDGEILEMRTGLMDEITFENWIKELLSK